MGTFRRCSGWPSRTRPAGPSHRSRGASPGPCRPGGAGAGAKTPAWTASRPRSCASGPSGSDTVNFVFQQAGNSPNPTLVGGSGKDVIFGTEGSDTLTGGASHDQFVFGPTSGGLVQHTVTDFETPLDKIDLREFDSVHSIGDLTGIQQQGSDTLITIDANDKVLLQNVQATSIHASNFLFHV